MITRDPATTALLALRDQQQSAVFRAELANRLTQHGPHPLLQLFPSPDGTVTILSVTTAGQWVETRIAKLEDVTTAYLEEMEARAAAHSPPKLHIV
jgi:hypothetical protein